MNFTPLHTNQNADLNAYLDPSPTDCALKELVIEAHEVFKALDDVSTTIRKIEHSLSSVKAHFPFKLLIKEDKESPLQQPLERHITRSACEVQGFFTKDYWYLSWEKCESSHDFRLFFIIDTVELIFFDFSEDTYEKELEQIEKFCSHTLLKKPLIEAEIPVKLECATQLIYFLDSFKQHLKSYRNTITNESVAF